MDADKEQITEVLIRYATGIDSKDWPLFRSCWADEVDLDYGELGEFTDPDAFTDLFAQVHNPMGNTYHRLSNFVVDVSGDTATARTYVHAVLMVTPDDNGPWVDVVGHYDDELVRGADGWRIRQPGHLHPADAHRWRRAIMTERLRAEVRTVGRHRRRVGGSRRQPGRPIGRRGLDLVLIARNGTKLDELAADVRERHGVEVRPVVLDLTVPDVSERVAEATDGLEVGLMIYNAGAANRTTEFLDDTFEDSLQQIKLACIGPVALARHFAPAMRERGRGGIVFVGISRLPGRVVSACRVFRGEGVQRQLRRRAVGGIAAARSRRVLHSAGYDMDGGVAADGLRLRPGDGHAFRRRCKRDHRQHRQRADIPCWRKESSHGVNGVDGSTGAHWSSS